MASDVEVVQNVLKDLIGHVCEEVDYISDDENSFYEWDFHELVETGTLPPDELYRVLEDYYLTTDHHYHWKRTPLTADSPPEGAYSRLGNARFSVHHSFYTPSYLRVGDGKKLSADAMIIDANRHFALRMEIMRFSGNAIIFVGRNTTRSKKSFERPKLSVCKGFLKMNAFFTFMRTRQILL
ncbi:unnamed protein product [Caenorhabditis auriculariae]|uniref:Uncharacterized protein n=1 Tax=Caenorhabditis auriculariae TaxID=2777116 RepID=A0A8S1HAW7_9PELO|nr:unnamed protein product [Caenorhabditis auriculariae]